MYLHTVPGYYRGSVKVYVGSLVRVLGVVVIAAVMNRTWPCNFCLAVDVKNYSTSSYSPS